MKQLQTCDPLPAVFKGITMDKNPGSDSIIFLVSIKNELHENIDYVNRLCLIYSFRIRINLLKGMNSR